MGVKGLLSYLQTNERDFFTERRLHNTKIIIDGSNFVHLVSGSHRYGGDYERLAREFKYFFNTMKKCNIAPYVVFDGGDQPDDRKLLTILRKKADRRKAQGQLCRGGLPLLSYETVLKLLVELKIPHVCCDFEADREIAVLAKRWGCPVFSYDSDFFVYGIQGGFVPLDYRYIDMTLRMHNTTSRTDTVIQPNYTLQKNEFAYVYVKCCTSEEFVNRFHREARPYILAVLATVMGNDYVDDSILRKFHQKLRLNSRKMSNKVATILNWLTTIDSEENALEQVLVTLEEKIDASGQAKAIVEENRQKAKGILQKSINEYKDIKEFESFDLDKEYDKQTADVIFVRNGVDQNEASVEENRQATEGILQKSISEDITEFKPSEIIYARNEADQMKATVEENRQKTKGILRKSNSEHKNIKEFETSEIIYARNEVDSTNKNDHVSAKIPVNIDILLPTWLVNSMRKCEVNGSFLQDVAVLHRVLFNCQVESVKQQSAYACSRDIRALIYGIVLNPCPLGDGESAENLSRQNSVEEFDREEEKEKRVFVKPLKQIGEFTTLPTLATMPSLSNIDRKHLLFAALKPIRKNLTEQMTELNSTEHISDPSQLMILIISHWFNHSQPQAGEAHLSALIIGIMVLHVRSIQPENKEDPLQFSPSAPVLFQEIENAIKSMNDEQVNRFKRHMVGYFEDTNGRIDDKIVHSFAQFQSTLLDTMILNQLLQNPVTIPSPSVILNCTFVYNLCRELQEQGTEMVNYLGMMLEMTSPLHRLFHSWKTMCFKGRE